MKTRDRILVKAQELFNRDGWQEVSIRDIADQLDMSPGNFTYHFSKKEELMKTILSELWKIEKENYNAFFIHDRSIGRFLQVIRLTLREQLDNHGILTVQYLFYNELVDEDVWGMDNRIGLDEAKRRIFRSILDELVRESELSASEEDISFLVSFLLMFTRSWILDHNLDGEQDIQRYLYLLAQQLYYFATDKGMRSIDAFLEDF